ncbi:uncharacterized protein N7473_012801 [Penicillium subrubescens]|uniref:uncharacterized protein n=1 Tax=Penicillium subrubescens TaxID=1316194 RepID=UPI00254535C6|nr:uncharacterized protein N7473_012801 [Penicillium subrubescens]KAJ5875454.1 hypothetical protein N7473_012801 [Penicillium subrubescens]
MRFHTVALLTGATAAAAGQTATLLLPGFQGRTLEAGIISKAGDATTYLVTCPTSVASADCGIPGKGMTAIAAPSSAELYQAYADGSTATVSCAIAGTTYASCSAAQGTVTVQHTLDSKNINWMPVTVTGDCSTSTPTPTPTPTITTTAVVQTSTSTSSPISSPVKSSSRPASSTPLPAALLWLLARLVLLAPPPRLSLTLLRLTLPALWSVTAGLWVVLSSLWLTLLSKGVREKKRKAILGIRDGIIFVLSCFSSTFFSQMR